MSDVFPDSHTRPLARCTFCGGPIRQHSSDEGTQSVEAVDDDGSFPLSALAEIVGELTTRAERAEAERDEWKRNAEQYLTDYQYTVDRLGETVDMVKQAESERDDAREALKALVASITGRPGAYITVDWAVIETARALVEGWDT